MDLYRLRSLHMYISLYVQIFMKLEFPRQIYRKTMVISNFMKIRPVGAELFHAVGLSELFVVLRMCLKRSFRFSAVRLEWYVGPVFSCDI